MCLAAVIMIRLSRCIGAMLPGSGCRIKWRGNHAKIGQEWCQAFWTLLLYDYSALLPLAVHHRGSSERTVCHLRQAFCRMV